MIQEKNDNKKTATAEKPKKRNYHSASARTPPTLGSSPLLSPSFLFFLADALLDLCKAQNEDYAKDYAKLRSSQPKRALARRLEEERYLPAKKIQTKHHRTEKRNNFKRLEWHNVCIQSIFLINSDSYKKK